MAIMRTHCWLVLVCFVLGTAASAQTSVVPVATGEWPPLVSAELPGQGPFTVAGREAFRRMKLATSVTFLPWRRAETSLEAGKVWGCYPYSLTADRQTKFLFSNEMAVVASRLFVRRNGRVPGGLKWKSFADLRGYLVGGVRGYWYEKDLTDAGVAVDYSSSDESSFEKLAHGRVDLVILNTSVGWNLVHKLYPRDPELFDVLPGSIHSSSLRVMVSRTFPGAAALLQKFNKALGTMVADGTLARLLPSS